MEVQYEWIGKKKTPDQYQLYFKCTSRLVETFKMVFGDLFEYEKNRAIIFQLDQENSCDRIEEVHKSDTNVS
jgi:hypothetical protein